MFINSILYLCNFATKLYIYNCVLQIHIIYVLLHYKCYLMFVSSSIWFYFIHFMVQMWVILVNLILYFYKHFRLKMKTRRNSKAAEIEKLPEQKGRCHFYNWQNCLFGCKFDSDLLIIVKKENKSFSLHNLSVFL